MRYTGAILVLGLLLSSACAAPPSQVPYQYWSRPDATEADFEAERAQCISASQAPMSIVASRGNVMRVDVNETAFAQCMRELGWQQR